MVAYKNDEVCRFCPWRPLSDLSGTGTAWEVGSLTRLGGEQSPLKNQ
ncbi:conserved hypothetical protein [Xenorhabdus nematophila F1]|nr:hypothetical protein [Xenorhabdus nematophila]CCW29415.1 conserved hypothetical protein [Xenorhabdus nematophila F1]